MIKLNATDIIKENKEPKASQVKQETPQEQSEATSRPEVVDAKVYKLKSAFVKNSVFITLSYVKSDNGIRPIEIFINSKDLTRAPEYVVLTRLISAIFRRSANPMFILEELQGIFDPNGGSFKEGKYYHSFYAEIADVIERFFYDVDILEKPSSWSPENDGDVSIDTTKKKTISDDFENDVFKICPECGAKALKTESGCDSCMACGYSKCDK